MITYDEVMPKRNYIKKFALIALGTYVISELVMPIEIMLSRGKTGLAHVAPIMGKWIIFNWIVPILIVVLIEKKDHQSLGLWIPKNRVVRYLIYASAGLVVPGIFIGFGTDFVFGLVEQIVYIGLAEEFYYRGYLMQRLCKWLGNIPGLLTTSFVFGLGHITFRLIYHGFDALIPAVIAGGQAFIGGLIFGLIFLKVRNIWPGVIIHISMNMYLPNIIKILNA